MASMQTLFEMIKITFYALFEHAVSYHLWSWKTSLVLHMVVGFVHSQTISGPAKKELISL